MRSRLGPLVLSGILLVVAGGCSGDPKLAEIGPRFQQDAQRILQQVAESTALEGSKPTVKQDDEVDCAEGKAKRVFEASVPVRTAADPDNMFENTINAVLANSNGYSIQTPADSDDLVRRETTLRADDYPATLKAVVVAAQVPTLTLSGEIDCIDAG